MYTKLLPPACKENNGEKSIDLHLSTIKTTHLTSLVRFPVTIKGSIGKSESPSWVDSDYVQYQQKNNAPVVFPRKICTVCPEYKPRKEISINYDMCYECSAIAKVKIF